MWRRLVLASPLLLVACQYDDDGRSMRILAPTEEGKIEIETRTKITIDQHGAAVTHEVSPDPDEPEQEKP